MEIKYEKDGYFRNAHSQAECVQLEQAGWKKVDESPEPSIHEDPDFRSGAEGSLVEPNLTGDERAEKGLDK